MPKYVDSQGRRAATVSPLRYQASRTATANESRRSWMRGVLVDAAPIPLRLQSFAEHFVHRRLDQPVAGQEDKEAAVTRVAVGRLPAG
jgi:hypothetical protein